MFENPRRGRQARNFTTNAPKILDLKSSSEQIFSRKLPLGAPVKMKEGQETAFEKHNIQVFHFCHDSFNSLYPLQGFYFCTVAAS